MLKENQDLKSYVSAFQSKISSLTGIHRMSALVALTETIFTAYQPSSPTIIKLSIHFLTNTAGLSDDAFNGLDPTASILSLITDFITNYYQVQNHQLAQFERDEIIAGKLISRPSLDGSFSTQPGYLRLCADRTVFTNAEEITEYFDTWSTLWRMLKTCLCAGVQFVPDVDLAIRRRIINGLKTHPLRQQFTVSGPEPARLWLGRYHKADEAGLVFEKQAGFNCGLTLDDVGHISIGMDAIHECLLDLFSLVLMQANIGTVKVPRVLPELKIFEPNRRLPDCTWPQFITVFTKTEQLYDNSLNKKTWPLTRPLAITSNLTSTESPGSGGDRAKDKKCKYCKGPHYTSDCPSPERASAEVCRQHLAGKCRNGAKHCKYLHPNKSETLQSGWKSIKTLMTTSRKTRPKIRKKRTPKETRMFLINPWLLTSRSLLPMTSPRPRLAPAPSLSVPSRSRSPSRVIKARNGTRTKACFFRSDAKSASSLAGPIGSRSHPPRASYLKLVIWSMTQRLTLMLSTVFLQTSPTSPTVNFCWFS